MKKENGESGGAGKAKPPKKAILSRKEPREWSYSFSGFEEGERLTVRIRRFYDRPKTVAIEIFPGGGVELRIPWNMSSQEAEQYVLKRREWIRKTRPKSLGFPDPPLCRYEEGEEHPYLGTFYPLKLSRGSRKAGAFREGALSLTLPSPERPEKVQQLLWDFYRQEATKLCDIYFRRHLPRFEARGMRRWLQIRIRHLTGSWGRCDYKNGKISMNLFLAACPEVCMEGVVVHELCHLFHPNHSPAFYAFFDSMLPDWRERWKLLRGVSLSAISRKYPV